ncbi:hypothetical protein [Kalamiella sp. sgz302252]|uniref:hypothetical protein n=1 Tax=Pantoea sp. sgz302252 TaxID=3341827 RepID=UPI0036D21097
MPVILTRRAAVLASLANLRKPSRKRDEKAAKKHSGSLVAMAQPNRWYWKSG